MRVKINSATGYLKKNDEKYLILDSTKEYESVWSEIRSEIKRINGGEKVFYEKNYCKISINTEDYLPLKVFIYLFNSDGKYLFNSSSR